MDQIDLNNIQTLQNCIFHPNNKITFIQVNDLSTQPNSSIFQCVDCFEQDLKFRGANHMLIHKIIQSDDFHFHPKWPPLNDQELIQKIHLKAKTMNSSQAILNQINSFFTQLKDDVIKKIDIAQKKAINQAEQMPFGKEQILRKYQEISQIKKLRELLLQDYNSSFDLYQQSCKDFIQQVQLQKDRNNKLFKDLLEQCEQTQDLIDFERLNQSKQILLEYLDEISIFGDKKEEQVIQSDQSNNRNTLQQNNNKVEKLMQLISNKSNYCTEEFLNQIKLQLQKLSIFFDKISFEKVNIENKKEIRFCELSYEKIDRVNEYVEHLIKIQSSPEYLQSVENSYLITQLQKILNNKLNFISNSFRDRFFEYLIETQSFQNQLNHDQMHYDQQSFDSVRNLEANYVKKLVQLVQLQQNQQQNFQNSFSQKVKKLIFNNYLYNQNELENVLKQFPIFDLIQQQAPKEINILNSIQLFKGNWRDGNQRIEISKNMINQFQISINENKYQGKYKGEYHPNCISQILKRDQKYIFRIQYRNLNNSGFYIGLMKNENINENFGYKDQMSIQFRSISNKIKYVYGSGIDKFIKDNSEYLLEENSTLELRVCLQEKKLEISDYPNDNIKLELKEEFKNNLLQDDLCLYFCLYKDQSSLILKEALIVENF